MMNDQEITQKHELTTQNVEENNKGIDNHKKAAYHYTEAAKHHLAAANYHAIGDHERAAQSTITAHGFVTMANESQKRDVIHHAMQIAKTN
jgi:hypothetical protein